MTPEAAVPPATEHPEHRLAVRILVIAASVFAFLSIFATWVDRQALDDNEWVDTSGRMLENREISDAVANYAVDQLFTSVDVPKLLRKRLPNDVKALSGPAAGGLREFAITAAEHALQTPRVQAIWRDANRNAHQQLVAILEDRSDAVSTTGGVVTLDLRPIIEQLAARIGLEKQVSEKLPPDVAQLEVVRADQLQTAQKITKLVKGLALLFSLGTLVLFGIAAYLARGRRWRVVLGYGLGLIVAGVATLALRKVMGTLTVDELVKTETVRPAANATYSIGTDLLSGIATTAIASGLLFVIAAWLASPAGSALAVRRALAPSFIGRPAIVWGVFAGVVLIFLIVSPPQSTRELVTTLMLIAIAGIGFEALGRKIRRECPDARPGDMANQIRKRLRELGAEGAKRVRSAIDEMTDGEAGDARLDQLAKLGELKEKGVLTEEEFAAEKKRLLESETQERRP